MTTRRKHTVLVVDDERDIIDMVSAILALADLEAVGASSIEEALAAVERRAPDAIVLDRNLEDSHCGELITSLAANPATAHIPILLMTGDEDSARTAALDTEIRGVVRKPFDPDILLRALRNVLSSPRVPGSAASGVRPRVEPRGAPHERADLLIVTSDAVLRRALDRVAQRRDISTRHAASFREAVEAARRWAPRAIALESGSSKAKTMELVRALRREQPWGELTPVLVLGARDDVDSRFAIADLDATLFLTDRSTATLERALGRLFAFSTTEGRVLVVGPVSELIVDTLRGHGLEVRRVDDPIAAVGAASSDTDVVLIDERVGGVSPFTLCGALSRSADSRLRSVVLLARRPDEESRRAALRAGAEEVLGPRESAEGVLACVRRRLERARAAIDEGSMTTARGAGVETLEHSAHTHARTAQSRVR